MKTRDMILVAMFAALTAIGAFIKIETPIVPFTLQYLFCAYSGVLLGSRKGALSQILYVVTGLIGIPIFTKGGGISYVFQPTFGYLIGFILCSYIVGKLTENKEKLTVVNMFIPVISGLLVIYAVGVPYLYMIVNFYFGKAMPLMGAVAAGFTPYIVPDLILSMIVIVTAVKIVPILKKANLV